MKHQLLVSTMNQTDDSIYKQMNLHTDAIVVNQTNYNGLDTISKDQYILKMYHFRERGVGLSRNSAMMRAEGEIVQFADDDMIFTDTHREDVIREFDNHPEADAILFSVESLNPERPLLKINKFARVSKLEALKYGCARLAIRRERVLYNNLSFSLLFGGGARYGSGEDTIFLQDCIRAGIKIYKSPVKIADVRQEISSWFTGYTEKYYVDKGALFAAALPKLCYAYALLSANKGALVGYSWGKTLKLFYKGIYEYKRKQKG